MLASLEMVIARDGKLILWVKHCCCGRDGEWGMGGIDWTEGAKTTYDRNRVQGRDLNAGCSQDFFQAFSRNFVISRYFPPLRGTMVNRTKYC